MLLGVSNFPNSATVEYQIVNKAGSVLQAWTSTSVTERQVSSVSNYSVYQIETTVITFGFEGWIMWRTSDEAYVSAELINTVGDYPSGAVAADGSNTSQTFKTNLTAGVDDYYKGSFLLFTSGSLKDQQRKITNYNQLTAFITVISPFTDTPSASDTFIIVNR